MIHRADYHQVLLDEAARLGATLRLDAEVVDIKTADNPHVVLQTGEVINADVIVGADGTRSGTSIRQSLSKLTST